MKKVEGRSDHQGDGFAVDHLWRRCLRPSRQRSCWPLCQRRTGCTLVPVRVQGQKPDDLVL